MTRILLAGVTDPSGLGDELQYVIGATLIMKNLSITKVDLFIPTASLNTPLTLIPNSSNIRILQGLLERTSIANILRKFISGDIAKQISQESVPLKYYTETSKNLVHKLKELIFKRYYENAIVATYVRPAVERFIDGLNYDGGFIGGHTIEYSAFFDYLLTYSCARTIVKGPLITYPISVSYWT